MLEQLIGSQILSVENDCIIVKKDNNIFKLEINYDEGDCCGYAEFTTNLLYSQNDVRNPVITNVSFEEGDNDYESRSTITFYGESKPLAEIESNAGSGSGYYYGAFVSLKCKLLDIEETLASW